MNISNELLRTFVAAAERSNFTAAGTIVHRTQSAVSMQMKRLEEEIGESLFQREGRAMHLTQTGEAFLPYARRMLRLHDEALTAIRRPEMNGRVRMGAPYDYAEKVLPKVLARFAEIWPFVEVEVVFDRGSRLRSALSGGRLDLIILSDIGMQPDAEPVFRDQVVWVTSDKHIVHETVPLPLAVYHQECSFRRWAVKSLEKIGREYRIAYTSPSVAGILAAVKSGLAVATVERNVVPPELRILTPEEGFPELPTATTSMIVGEAKQSLVVQTLANHIAESFNDIALVV